jgi:hypothetical protein
MLVAPISPLGRQGSGLNLLDFSTGTVPRCRARRAPRDMGVTAATTLLVLMSFLVGIGASNPVLAGNPLGDSHGLLDTPTLAVSVADPEAGGVGAPPGFGLTDPWVLEARGPIYIGSNADFTWANGVRSGTGAAADPYVISNWYIDASLYTWAMALIHIESTDAYVIIENNKIVNLWDWNQWEAIQLGHYPAILRTSHVTIRNNLIVNAMHAYGIAVREGSSDVYIGANYVELDATIEHVFGIATDRNVHDVTIFGNYVDAYTSGNFQTAGIRIGDTHIDDARRATGVVVRRNTVVNATAGGIVSLSSTGTRIEANLVYTDYGFPKVVGPDYPRGIMTEQNSYGTMVIGNQIHSLYWGIEVGADGGWFASNLIFGVDTAIYVVDNGTFPGATSFDETIYDTTYDTVASGGIRLPAGFQGTVVDLGRGIRPTDMTPVFVSILGTATRISYTWSGTLLNLSATVNGVVLFDTAVTSEGQTVIATWSGSIATLKVTSLLVGRVTFELQASTDVGFSGSGFAPSETYNLTRTDAGGTTTLLSTSSSPSGSLAFTIPFSSARSTFDLHPAGFVDPLAPMSVPSVTGTSGANGWYVSSVTVTLTAESPTGSSVSIAFRVDRAPWSTYTSPFSVGEGNHTLEWQASDAEGHQEAIRSLPLWVDVTNPTITRLIPGGRVTDSYEPVSWTGSDGISGIARYEVKVDSGAFQRIGTTQSYSQYWIAGSHTVQVKAVDRAGREGFATTSFTVEPGIFGSGGILQIFPVAFPIVVAIALLVASFVILRVRSREKVAPPVAPRVRPEPIPWPEMEEPAAATDELSPDEVGTYDFPPKDSRPEEFRRNDSPDDDYPSNDYRGRELRYDDFRPDHWRN